jgi:D-2-hydroxyacid dehydrogenase (NADP+)
MIYAEEPIWQEKYPDVPLSPPDEAEIWLVRNKPIIAGPKVKWVQFMGTGLDGVLEGSEIPDDVIITNASGVAAIPMAEYVLTVMLAFVRKLPELAWMQEELEWDAEFISGELADKTVAILGYGSIGREVARLCHSFGMHILACKKNLGNMMDKGWCADKRGDYNGSIPERIVSPLDLEEIVAKADFFVICAPLTKDTRSLVNWNVFSAMKNHVYLINVGRGAIIDDQALGYFLEEGRIAGAALDVFAREPLPQDSSLWDMSNVIISPHSSCNTPRYMERLTDLFCQNLGNHLEGIKLWNIVDRKAGY